MPSRTLDIDIHCTTYGLGRITSEPNVEVIEVVKTRIAKTGDGSIGDPVRELTQYWSRDGKLLATVDPQDEQE